MTDLVAAIRAAIDETERIAQACWPGVDFHAGEDPSRPGTFDVEAYESGSLGNFVEVGRVRAPFAEHIARHDPASVLRRCAADRKILDAWDANERELEANSAEFSRPARPMEDEAERFRRLGNAKAQGWELQGRRWALRLALTGLAEAYGVEA